MISSEGNTIPTWGYASGGDAKIFDLEPGEALPDGWADTPAAWLDTAHPADGPLDDPAPADFGDEYLAEIIAAEDKEALDAFAAEKGVKLDRRKSFDKMLSDYREAASQ